MYLEQTLPTDYRPPCPLVAPPYCRPPPTTTTMCLVSPPTPPRCASVAPTPPHPVCLVPPTPTRLVKRGARSGELMSVCSEKVCGAMRSFEGTCGRPSTPWRRLPRRQTQGAPPTRKMWLSTITLPPTSSATTTKNLQAAHEIEEHTPSMTTPTFRAASAPRSPANPN